MPAAFTVISGVVLLLLIPTAYAGYIGAPYVPTWRRPIQRALASIKLSAADHLVDLGAGDGRVLVAAARRGAAATGYELSPVLWFIAVLRTLRFRRVHVLARNFYKQSLPADTTVVFIFLMPDHMQEVLELLARQSLPKARRCLVYAFPFKTITPLEVIKEPKCLPLYIYDWSKLTNQQRKTPT
jgi:SAM-dependent methyltransferase